MTALAPMLLVLVCAIFGTTLEADDDRNLNNDELYEGDIFGTTSGPADFRHKLVADELNQDVDIHRTNPRLTHLYNSHRQMNSMRHYDVARRKREDGDTRCIPFTFEPGKKIITNPKNDPSDSTYSKNTTCFTTISADEGTVIELTFVEFFQLEGRMPKCEYDYLEIHDGMFGYAMPMYKFCGKGFPPTITSYSRYMWLKFHSDDTVEYAGFKIEIGFPIRPARTIIHDSCFITADVTYGAGVIGSKTEAVKRCREESKGSLDIQWKIETPSNTRIYLNITEFKLAKPNECKSNLIQVFGSEPNFDHHLMTFCGSVATAVTTKTEAKEKGPTNIMYVRMFTTDTKSNFTAEFTGFRTLGTGENCDLNSEFNCMDSTCIDILLRCNSMVNCRLKSDEDPEICERRTDSLLKEPETKRILIILSLILTGICSVLIFKCARKVYLDQKQINAHRAMSSEDRMDKLLDAPFMLDPSLLTREAEPRASLERENRSNEMVKQQRNKRKSSSIESDLFEPNDDWSENRLIPTEEIRVDVAKRKRDFSRKEESLRSNKGSQDEEEKENRDVAVEAQGSLEAACQTRESLFQTDPLPSSDDMSSSPNGRSFSTLKYSGAKAALPSPAPASSQITIELMRQLPKESSQRKQDRRPMSSETTRSAPDVIIVPSASGYAEDF